MNGGKARIATGIPVIVAPHHPAFHEIIGVPKKLPIAVEVGCRIEGDIPLV